MKNYIQEGDVLTFTAPSDSSDTDLSSGDGVLIGSIFGVCVTDVAMGDSGQMKTEGVFELPKTSAQAWTVGAKIYWDDTNKVCTTSSSGNSLIGVATAAAANPSSTGYVRLNGKSVG